MSDETTPEIVERRTQNRFVLHENGAQIPLREEFQQDGSTHRRWRRVRGADGECYEHTSEDALGRWRYRHTEE